MRRDSGGFYPSRMSDPLISDLRRFVLSYGEHDQACPARDATGPAAIDPAACACGFTPRLEQLLRALEDRLRPAP